MESAGTKLTNIGKKIRQALDAEGNAAEELRVERQRFVDHVTSRDGRRGRRTPWIRRLGVGVTVAALAAGGLVVWLRNPISFQVGVGSQAGAVVPGRLGDLVEAKEQETALRFSEGSSIVMDRGAQLRVLSAESNGARVLIESGRAEVAIAHLRRKASWRFEAGPIAVRVTGTRFRVDWNPKESSFGLELKEGSVIVSGGCLAAPVTVSGRESLQVSCRTPPPAAPVWDAPSTAPAPATVKTPGSTVPGRGLAYRESKSADDGSWQSLVAAGHYGDGLRAAERAGFSRVCRSAKDVELLALADAARLSGRTARAVEALLALRQRFPGSPSAATGAFALGRLAFERRAAYGEAARWFGTYLDEQPAGPLMGDAVGRLMEARHRAGERAAARRDAERYLLRFPEGPYAATARAILAE